jgi:4-hydroxy-4-methyl-2-oxoglutarate aldolase
MEYEKRGLYEAGKLSLDINNMRPQLEAKGLIYE